MYAKAFWCKLVRINVNLIKHLTDLKHRHLAGAFFLALILYHPDVKKRNRNYKGLVTKDSNFIRFLRNNFLKFRKVKRVAIRSVVIYN